MAFNLQRDAKIYVSEVLSGFTSANTWEVRVLSGFSVNQTNATQDITVSEAGATPSRGIKRYNTALNPVDVTFSTYIRPYKVGAGLHECPERVLWEAAVGAGVFGTNTVSSTTGVAISNAGSNVQELKKLYLFVDYGTVQYRVTEYVVSGVDINFDLQGIATLAWTGQGSAIDPVIAAQFPQAGQFTPVPSYAQFIKNKLSTISLVGNYNRTFANQVITLPAETAAITLATVITVVNAVAYTLNVTVNGVLQTISYTATGTSATIQQIVDALNLTLGGASIIPAVVGNNVTWTFITDITGSAASISVADGASNGLFAQIAADTDVLAPTIAATSPGTTTSRTYVVPITGGSIKLANNITFLVPDQLGVVNEAIGHFTGVRMWDGTLTAYLKTGVNETSSLYADLVNANTDTTNAFALTINVGGTVAGNPRLTFTIPTAQLSIPSIDTQDVISTTITFAAIASDLGATNDITLQYVAGNQ